MKRRSILLPSLEYRQPRQAALVSFQAHGLEQFPSARFFFAPLRVVVGFVERVFRAPRAASPLHRFRRCTFSLHHRLKQLGKTVNESGTTKFPKSVTHYTHRSYYDECFTDFDIFVAH
jgi:hypothetical protein